MKPILPFLLLVTLLTSSLAFGDDWTPLTTNSESSDGGTSLIQSTVGSTIYIWINNQNYGNVDVLEYRDGWIRAKNGNNDEYWFKISHISEFYIVGKTGSDNIPQQPIPTGLGILSLGIVAAVLIIMRRR